MAFTFFLFSSAFGQGTWSVKADIGLEGRAEAVSFSIGTKGYVATGKTASGLKQDLWEYDPATDVWTAKANLPGPKRFGAIAFVIGSKAYVGLGWNQAGNVLHDFYEYDPSTDTWTEKADYGNPNGKANATAFAIGTKGYVATGGDNIDASLNEFWEYDQPTDTWTQLGDFGGYARENATGFAIGSTGYITCGMGQDYPYYYNDLWAYDPATDSWTEMTNMGDDGRRQAACFVIGTNAYIGTGFNNDCVCTGYVNTMYAYNSLTDTWSPATSFPGSERCWSVGFSIGEKGYIGAGGLAFGPYYKDFFEYFNCTDAIEICNSLDDNCNGATDEGLAVTTFYADADGDFYGDADVDSVSCFVTLTGYVSDSNDCDDTNAAIYPGATEILDGVDNNCNDEIDEGLTGVHEAFLNEVIEIYPNPASSFITIETDLATEKTIYITNALGQIVQTIITSENTITIDLNNICSGVYFIKMEDGVNSVTKKFVKQ